MNFIYYMYLLKCIKAFIKIEIFCNIINLFTVTFDKFNAYLMNKSINFSNF